MFGAVRRCLPVLCVLAASACSLVGSSDFRIVETDAGIVEGDSGGLPAVDAGAEADEAGGAEAVAPEPPPSCPHQSLCTDHVDCCGFAEGLSQCVVLGQGVASRCLAVCTSSDQCLDDEICNPTSGAESVCAPADRAP